MQKCVLIHIYCYFYWGGGHKEGRLASCSIPIFSWKIQLYIYTYIQPKSIYIYCYLKFVPLLVLFKCLHSTDPRRGGLSVIYRQTNEQMDEKSWVYYRMYCFRLRRALPSDEQAPPCRVQDYRRLQSDRSAGFRWTGRPDVN